MDHLKEEHINDPVQQLIWETTHGYHPWSDPTASLVHPSNNKGGNDEDTSNEDDGIDILPTAAALSLARCSLPSSLPSRGQGYTQTKSHIVTDIIPGLNASSISPNYYGFVTGGVTPAALLADHIVSAYDQNVQVHMPEHSVTTDVEACSLRLLLDLFHLDSAEWAYATLTTGATASNLLGLACGRESVLRAAAAAASSTNGAGNTTSVGEHGVLQVMRSAGLESLQVLSTMPHSSVAKVAGILGIGRANVKNVATTEQDNDSSENDAHPLGFDFDRLERELSTPRVANIVAVSSGEVNTGHFATGLNEMKRIRQLCDRYNAWLHVDGAFGIFARILDAESPEFNHVRRGSEGLELADSIAGDAHKLLNVPYDCGFFFCRHPDLAGDVFQNPNAAYLSSGSRPAGSSSTNLPSIMSPNNIGIENSRRFRALPVYATLLAYGRDGYRAMLERQVRLARRIASWIFNHPKYNSLPASSASNKDAMQSTFMIVLFSAVNDELNGQLAKKINSSSKMFVSGTVWGGRSASRIAISNWKVDVERDFEIVTGVLDDIARN